MLDQRKKVAGQTIIEVIGGPGTGKSTLAAELCALDGEATPTSIYFTRPRNLPLLIPAYLSRRSLLDGQEAGGRRPVKEMLWILRLEIFGSLLRRQARRRARVVVLDQGPAYTLARLLDRRPLTERSLAFREWFEDSVRLVAGLLDVVVMLEASDEVSLDRIRTRTKWHRLKEVPDDDLRRALARERALYEEIGERLERHGTRILDFDTGERAVRSIASEVLASAHGPREGPPSHVPDASTPRGGLQDRPAVTDGPPSAV